jgi:hypothetical protein
MKPTDYRDMTWEEIKCALVEDRLAVYNSLQVWGPCTTRQLAVYMSLDILSVRPRMTELCQMGLARAVEVGMEKRREDQSVREGYYESVGMADAEKMRRYGVGVQCEMQMGGV